MLKASKLLLLPIATLALFLYSAGTNAVDMQMDKTMSSSAQTEGLNMSDTNSDSYIYGYGNYGNYGLGNLSWSSSWYCSLYPYTPDCLSYGYGFYGYADSWYTWAGREHGGHRGGHRGGHHSGGHRGGGRH